MEPDNTLNPDYCYSPKELAFLWNLDDETIRRRFKREPGVLILPNERTKGRRTYTTMRIPGTVAIRVKLRMTVKPGDVS